MAKPDFLSVGMQKGGTTWLYKVLAYHPEVFKLPCKELVYFNALHIDKHKSWPLYHRRRQAMQALNIESTKVDVNDNKAFASFRKRLSWFSQFTTEHLTDENYKALFDIVPENNIVGDFSPDYIMLPDAGIEHVLAINADIKAIANIRHPVDRAWSHVKMIARNEGMDISNSDNLNRVMNRADVVRRGYFKEDINRWKSHLGKNFLVMTLNEIEKEPLTQTERLCDFLSIPFDANTFEGKLGKVFEGQSAEMPQQCREFFSELYAEEISYFETL